MKIKFIWDEQKAIENDQKHGVRFEEAQTVFLNFPLEIYYDPEHSASEERYLAYGFSNQSRALLAVHMENKRGSVIRIISARKATRKEVREVFGSKRGKKR